MQSLVIEVVSLLTFISLSYCYHPVVVYDVTKTYSFLNDNGEITYETDGPTAEKIQRDARTMDGNWVFLQNKMEGRAYQYSDIRPAYCTFNQIFNRSANHHRNCYGEKVITIYNDDGMHLSENLTRAMLRGKIMHVHGKIKQGNILQRGYKIINTGTLDTHLEIEPNCSICNVTYCKHVNDVPEVFHMATGSEYHASCGTGQILFVYREHGTSSKPYEFLGTKIIMRAKNKTAEHYFPSSIEARPKIPIAYHYNDHIYNRNIGYYSDISPATEMFGAATHERKKRNVDTGDANFHANYDFAPIGSFFVGTTTFINVLAQLREAASHVNTIKNTINSNNRLLEKDSREQNIDISKNTYEIAVNRLWINNVQYRTNLVRRSVDHLQTKQYALQQSLTRTKETDLLLLNRIAKPESFNATAREEELKEKCNGTLQEITHRTAYSLAFCKNKTFFQNTSEISFKELSPISALLRGSWYILNGNSLNGPFLEVGINTESKQVYILEKSIPENILETLKLDSKEKVIEKCKAGGYVCVWIDGLGYGDSTFTFSPDNEKLIETLKNIGIESFNIERKGEKYSIECLEPRVKPAGQNNTNITVKLTTDDGELCNIPLDIQQLIKRAQAAEQRRLKLQDVVFAKDDSLFGLALLAEKALGFVEDTADKIVDVVKDVDPFSAGPWLFGNISGIIGLAAMAFCLILFFYVVFSCWRRPAL